MFPKNYHDHECATVKDLGKTKKFHIPMFRGRPNRDTVISADDICNLKIALELNKNSQEFIDSLPTTWS